VDAELDEFEKHCRALSQHKMTCTGEPLSSPPRSEWPGLVTTRGDFHTLVSSVYKLWRESWKLDVGFLRTATGDSRVARDFDQMIYQLRTAMQHTDNPDAMAYMTEWTNDLCGGHNPTSKEDWSACGRALIAALSEAVVSLTAIAVANRSQESFRHAWWAKYSESIQAVVTRVAADLNLNLTVTAKQHHERQVEKRWSRHRLRAGETASQVMASFAEASLVAEVRRLPGDYTEILDELRVLGTNDAVAALRLAHSVAEISGTTGETYVKLVTSVWTTLRPGSRQ